MHSPSDKQPSKKPCALSGLGMAPAREASLIAFDPG
jgi:hypothetical protein